MSSTEKFPIEWRFGKVESGRREGWNDSAIAQFKENRLQALTREIIQNSMDARDKDKDGVVRVCFEERMMSKTDIPNIITLRGVLGKCKKDATDEPSDIKEEIQAVIDYAKQDKIRVLSIKDTGTKGMPGPCENGKPFYRYLKATGQSGGEENRAGSHGIGKMAPLTSSNMRTIFVSTTWKEKRELRELLQGRANLRSHMNGKYLYEGVGYWGRGFEPIQPKECDHRWLRRAKKDGPGTTIHILGWSPTEKEWADVILGYAAINFFAALEKKKLEICISQENCEDKILNKKNIKATFEKERIREAMKRIGSLDEFEDSQFFHKCIASDKGNKPDNVDYFGKSTLRLIVEPGAPRKIAIIRNYMLITTYFKGFWKLGIPLKYKECGGVFECKDENGNLLLRSMEPPAHNQLSSDIPYSSDAQENARNALGALARYLKERVDKEAKYKDSGGSEVTIMRELLGGEGGDTGLGGDKLEFDPQSEFSIKLKPIKLDTLPPIDPFGNGDKPLPPPPPGSEPNPVHLLKHRVIRTGENTVRVVITSAETKEAYLLIREVGEVIYKNKKDMSEYQFMIKDDSGNMVEKYPISLRKGKSISRDFLLSRKIVGGLMLSAIENEDKVK